MVRGAGVGFVSPCRGFDVPSIHKYNLIKKSKLKIIKKHNANLPGAQITMLLGPVCLFVVRGGEGGRQEAGGRVVERGGGKLVVVGDALASLVTWLC